MAGKIVADTIEGTTTTETVGGSAVTIPNSTDTKFVVNGSAKAWIQFVMGTPTISSSLNISTMTDTADGDAAANIISSFASATGYSLTGGGNHYTLGNDVVDNDSASVISYRQFDNSSALADGAGTNSSMTAHGALA
jgi:hypothetical protein|tara:strand:- start:60 stop:470 length:411 start_codon:yes stop_codon:yes gene_type:complete